MAEGQKTEIEEVTLQKWTKVSFKRSTKAMWVTLIRYLLAFVVVEVALYVLMILNLGINISLGNLSSIFHLAIVAIMICLVPIFLFVVFVVVQEWTGTTYTVVSGQYRVVGDFVDQRHGKIILDVKGIFHREKVYPANMFIRSELQQPWWARIFRYGHVRLVARPPARNSGNNIKNVLILHLDDPEGFLRSTQAVIDSAIGMDNQLGT